MGTGKAPSLDKQDLKRGQGVSGLRSRTLECGYIGRAEAVTEQIVFSMSSIWLKNAL